VQQDLRTLFAQALDHEPAPAPGDPVEQAMAHGRRIRRRRGLLVGGSAAAAVLAVTVALNLTSADPPPPRVSAAAMVMAPADASCTWPVRDDASDVSIFLTDAITQPQLAALREALTADPAVREMRFETRLQAYEKFKRLWADSPDFVAAVSPGSLPQSFRLRLAEPSGFRQFAAGIRARAGVQDVIGRSCPGTPE
jgi:cell division transport system permease protein